MVAVSGLVSGHGTVESLTFVGGKSPSGWSLKKAKSGFGYDLAGAGFAILLR